jgi:hypothetical protein
VLGLGRGYQQHAVRVGRLDLRRIDLHRQSDLVAELGRPEFLPHDLASLGLSHLACSSHRDRVAKGGDLQGLRVDARDQEHRMVRVTRLIDVGKHPL